ncbi:tmRNA [Deinococcus hopiensis KR-140]|uniref:TmRNA n=1 Tax=Deinococcus hopiensis KR-140 TaxID=695939 RepID=A0A1W1UCP0_9DEIO|nr:tmRNA [Deinococcus hopiensis KR-140]
MGRTPRTSPGALWISDSPAAPEGPVLGDPGCGVRALAPPEARPAHPLPWPLGLRWTLQYRPDALRPAPPERLHPLDPEPAADLHRDADQTEPGRGAQPSGDLAGHGPAGRAPHQSPFSAGLRCWNCCRPAVARAGDLSAMQTTGHAPPSLVLAVCSGDGRGSAGHLRVVLRGDAAAIGEALHSPCCPTGVPRVAPYRTL